MNNDKTMSEDKDTVVSKLIDKGAEMAFDDDTIANAAQGAVEHVAGAVVDHAAAGFVGVAAENTFNYFVERAVDHVAAPIAPARIAAEAVKDIVLLRKSPDEMGQSVRNKSFNAVVIAGVITGTTAALSGAGLLAIPATIGASYIVANRTSRMYGGIAQGVAWGVAKIFKRT